jgi:hypothetical protein
MNTAMPPLLLGFELGLIAISFLAFITAMLLMRAARRAINPAAHVRAAHRPAASFKQPANDPKKQPVLR